MDEIEIHTLNARDNMALRFVYGFARGNPSVVHREIMGITRLVRDALAAFGVDYAKLGPALTPRPKRREIGLFFEIGAIASSGYAFEVHNRVLKLLSTKESHSVLAGDLTGDQLRLRYLLGVHLSPSRVLTLHPVGTQLFCIYVTNCSDNALASFTAALRDYTPFVGACDLTYGSDFRSYLADRLSPRYLQFGNKAIQSKEDDEPFACDQNTRGYDFAENGFDSISIQSTFFDLLLGYKIERPPTAYDEPDQFFALSAISRTPSTIPECQLVIDDSKHKYLEDEKGGTIARLGLRGYPKEQLENAIWAKINSNYLYRLRLSEKHGFAGFSILLELDAIDSDQSVRVVAGFGFDEVKKRIRLVTLFG